MRDEVEFNGRIYKRYPEGKHPNYYYCETKSTKRIYHRDVWEYYNGAIPKGYVIHHVDFNPLNNDISNLVCITPVEHSKIHYQHNLGAISEKRMQQIRAKNGYTKENWKERRKKSIKTVQEKRGICQECGKPFTVTNVHQKYCSPNCRKRANTRASQKEYICEYCGKHFMASSYYERKACSTECAHKINIIKRQGGSI